jgi:hypothetical protein
MVELFKKQTVERWYTSRGSSKASYLRVLELLGRLRELPQAEWSSVVPAREEGEREEPADPPAHVDGLEGIGDPEVLVSAARERRESTRFVLDHCASLTWSERDALIEGMTTTAPLFHRQYVETICGDVASVSAKRCADSLTGAERHTWGC